jgi:hypothetical protein
LLKDFKEHFETKLGIIEVGQFLIEIEILIKKLDTFIDYCESIKSKENVDHHPNTSFLEIIEGCKH